MLESSLVFNHEEIEKRSKEIKEIPLSLDSHPSFIGAWMLDDVSVCDKLLEKIKKENDRKGTVGLADGTKIVDPKAKDSIDLSPDLYDPDTYKYLIELQKILRAYIAKHPMCEHVAPFAINFVNLQKYPKGGGYHQWHTERNGLFTSHRHLVYMTYLNDISDGGETEFLYQKLKVKPRKGLTLIWPVDWTHTHRGLPSMTEEKCIATGWYDFVGEKDGN
tara:strand:- start:25 stop:681 length:657 start_codon:yes stop_codon:yes gene_type:complete